MVELRSDLYLPQEPLGTEGGGELRLQNLDGDPAVVLEVSGQVDDGHPPAAELALEAVAVAEGPFETAQQIGHTVAAAVTAPASLPPLPSDPPTLAV